MEKNIVQIMADRLDQFEKMIKQPISIHPKTTDDELGKLIYKYVRWGKEHKSATDILEYIIQSEEILYDKNVNISPNTFGKKLQKCGFRKVNVKNPDSTEYLTKMYCVELKDYSKEVSMTMNNDFYVSMGKYAGYKVSEIDDIGYLCWFMNTIKLSPEQINVIEDRIIELRGSEPTPLIDVDNGFSV